MRLLIAMSAMAQAISIFAAIAAYQAHKLNKQRPERWAWLDQASPGWQKDLAEGKSVTVYIAPGEYGSVPPPK